jgi:hypothetical protein
VGLYSPTEADGNAVSTPVWASVLLTDESEARLLTSGALLVAAVARGAPDFVMPLKRPVDGMEGGASFTG